MTRAVIVGSGSEIAPTRVTNAQMARMMDTSDEWIRERSGVEQRYFATPQIATSDLGVAAAAKALETAGVAKGDVDLVVFATMTPDHYFPGCGTILQHKLGLESVPCYDIREQCSGFLYGLQLADAHIRAGMAETVLLVGAEVHVGFMPWTSANFDYARGISQVPPTREEFDWNSRFRHLVVLFGDAAGAMVFRASAAGDGRGILGCLLYGDGGHKDVLAVPGAGSTRRPWVTAEQIAAGETVPVMDGRQVFKLAVTRMPEATRALLARHGHGVGDLDLLVMHQANLRINEAAQKALGLPDAKVHNNIDRYGNTTSATLPLAFHEARAAGKAPAGALVAFAALGAGLHWGAVLMRV